MYESILKDLLREGYVTGKPDLEIMAGEKLKVEKFPYQHSFDNNSIVITKKGGMAVYMAVSQKYREREPVVNEGYFTIDTKFEGNSEGFELEAGREVKLVAELEVKENLEYVMVTIPLPSGVSYVN